MISPCVYNEQRVNGISNKMTLLNYNWETHRDIFCHCDDLEKCPNQADFTLRKLVENLGGTEQQRFFFSVVKKKPTGSIVS